MHLYAASFLQLILCFANFSLHFNVLHHLVVHFHSPLVFPETVEAMWKTNCRPFLILVMDVTLEVQSFGEQPIYKWTLRYHPDKTQKHRQDR